MNILLKAIADFITVHWFLTFLILISIFHVRIDIGKKKNPKEEEPKESEKAKEEPKNEKEKPL